MENLKTFTAGHDQSRRRVTFVKDLVNEQINNHELIKRRKKGDQKTSGGEEE